MSRQASAVAILLILHAGLLTYAGWRMSPTMDEPAHLAAGVAHWRFGRFSLYAVNPPLVRMVAALPVLMVGCEEDWSDYHSRAATRAEFPVGRDFAVANGRRFFWLMTLARWACIPFSLLGAWICWRWANELFGPPCGLIAMTLWCFSPNMIAHGALITSDIAAASFGVAATYSFWRWIKQPQWATAMVTGGVLGMALLIKATWIILGGLWPVIWLIGRKRLDTTYAGERLLRSHIGREGLQLTGMFVVAMYLLNAGYAFEQMGTPLGGFAFVSQSLRGDDDGSSLDTGNRFATTWLAELPVPLPANFVLGIDAQKRDFEQRRVKYLRGELSRDGWWYFYVYALLVKVPLGTWLLAILALLTAWRSGSRLRDGVFLITVPVALFLLTSSQTGLNYLRYLLPAFPFAFIAISHVGQSFRKTDWRRPCVVIGVVAMMASSLWTYPHSLSFFNLAAGGAQTGYRHLVDSNFDWGQDLFELKRWLDEHPEARSLQLAYFGMVDPQQAGIDFRLPPVTEPTSFNEPTNFEPPPGWYAVSATHAYGGFSTITSADGELIPIKPGAFGYFRRRKPTAIAGTTILIYDVE